MLAPAASDLKVVSIVTAATPSQGSTGRAENRAVKDGDGETKLKQQKRMMNWGNKRSKPAVLALCGRRRENPAGKGSLRSGCCCSLAGISREKGSTPPNPIFPGNNTPTPAFMLLLVATSNDFCCQRWAAESGIAKPTSKCGETLSHGETGRARGVPGCTLRVGESS